MQKITTEETSKSLRGLRDRLSWRKWYRNIGLAYVTPITSELDRAWRDANQRDRSPRSFDRLLLDITTPRPAATELNLKLLQTELLEFYKFYGSASAAVKLHVWCLQADGDDERIADDQDWRLPEIRAFRRAYFRETFVIDGTARSISDACLWHLCQTLDRDAYHVRLIELLNVSHPALDTARLGFELRSAKGLLPFGQVQVLERFEWSVGWRDRELLHGLTRLAPTANAVQMVARRLIDTRPDCNTGLIADPLEAYFEQGDVRARVLVTNVMVEMSGVPRGARCSCFLQHEQQPRVMSVFLRPDQDPAITHTLDLQYETRVDLTDEDGLLRWIVVLLQDADEPSDLLGLLAEVEQLFEEQPINFHLDAYRSNSCPTGPTVDLFLHGRTEHTTLERLCREHADGLVLLGRPRIAQYAPQDSDLFQQSKPGVLPWSLNRPDLFHWKCYSTQSVDQLTRPSIDQVSCLVQRHDHDNYYLLDDRRDIVRYLSQLDEFTQCPAVRLWTSLQPVPIYKVAAKRVFAFADGTLFVTERPLKLIAPGVQWMQARAGRYLDRLHGHRLPVHVDSVTADFAAARLSGGSRIWLPMQQQNEQRDYTNVPHAIAPLVHWLDQQQQKKN